MKKMYFDSNQEGVGEEKSNVYDCLANWARDMSSVNKAHLIAAATIESHVPCFERVLP